MILARAFAVILLFLLPPAAQAQLVTSDPVILREGSVRLLAERTKGGELTGAVEIRLSEGYKTYWKNPGDSGVPPQFDFSPSAGVHGLNVSYPFPAAFDDGAGGVAFGYKHAVLFPFAAQAGAGAHIRLKLDFAVCSTLCIPLMVEISLKPDEASHATLEDAFALARARAQLPALLEAQGAVVERQSETAFLVTLPYAGDAASVKVFPAAGAFFEVKGIKPAGAGQIAVALQAQPMPGAKTLGPLSLVYGVPGASFERKLEVDSPR